MPSGFCRERGEELSSAIDGIGCHEKVKIVVTSHGLLSPIYPRPAR